MPIVVVSVIGEQQEEAFQNRSSASIPKSPSRSSTAVVFQQSVRLAPGKGGGERAEPPHVVLFAGTENWLGDRASV